MALGALRRRVSGTLGRVPRAFSGCALGLSLLSCADAGGSRVSVPLVLAGSDVSSFLVGEWQVELSRADLAFGPLYLCAGQLAGDLCDTAQAEWLDTKRLDALSDRDMRVGTLEGFSAETQSFMYDLGISSSLTEKAPVIWPAAADLDGQSVVIEGKATSGTRAFEFVLSLVLAQPEDTELGVPLVRSSLSDAFQHTLRSDDRLRLHFDPRDWVDSIDFQAIYDAAACVDACPAPLVLAEDSQAARALRNALLTRAKPRFEWQ